MIVSERRLNILWIVPVDPRYHMRHGRTLRFVNLSKGLTSSGHHVYYLVNNNHYDRTARNSFLDMLRDSHALTDYFEFNPGSGPKWRQTLARFLVHPAGRNWIMSPVWTPCKREVLGLLERYH